MGEVGAPGAACQHHLGAGDRARVRDDADDALTLAVEGAHRAGFAYVGAGAFGRFGERGDGDERLRPPVGGSEHRGKPRFAGRRHDVGVVAGNLGGRQDTGVGLVPGRKFPPFLITGGDLGVVG